MESKILIDAQETYANQARNRILTLIDGFKGLNCMGYFVLGKPFLTKIVADFISFFLVLLQFRISENEQKMYRMAKNDSLF